MNGKGELTPNLATRKTNDLRLQALLNLFHPASGRNSMVECQLPKLKVASSILVARSKFPKQH